VIWGFWNLNFFHPLILAEVIEELLNGFFQNGMDEVSIDLSQGDEDKFAILDERVRNLEFLGLNFKVVEKEKVQIDGSGSPSESLCAAQLSFDGLQRSEEFGSFEIGLNFYDSVDKPILGSVTNGSRSEEGGFCQKLVAVSL
jgi:hypothetical protein